MMTLSTDYGAAVCRAIEVVAGVLSDEQTPPRLARYYDRNAGYAGSTFAGLGENDPSAITATDLLAVTTLSVSIGSRPTRLFLEDSETQRQVEQCLVRLPQKSLEDVDDSDMSAMADLYELVKTTLATPGRSVSDRWVTASKIVARKRPALFPVRDSVVRKALEIMKFGDYAVDWSIYQRIMRDEAVVDQLQSLPSQIMAHADGRDVDLVHESPLRLLDAALWMKFSRVSDADPE